MQIAILFMENRNAKGPIVHFKCPSTDLKCWSKRVNLHFCRLVSTYILCRVCTRKLLECQRKEWLFPSFSTFSAWDAKLPSYPSQNTQSCIKGLLVWWYRISVFGTLRQPGQYWKKNSGPIMSNFWGLFFHVFRGKNVKIVLKIL